MNDTRSVFSINRINIESAITIIRSKLELDPELHTRTSMKVEQITSLLEFCLKTTCF